MASESDIFSSAGDSAPQPCDQLPSNFFSVMDRQYPDKDKPLAAGRKRKTKGAVLYVCRLCPNWSHGNRATAVLHIKSRHDFRPPPSPSPKSSNQRSLPAMFASTPTSDNLRQTFNRQAYNEAIIGLLTRRRAPFSAVEWNELKDLALACNPAIEDLLITCRRTAVRYVASNYELYKVQIRDSLASAISPIHISSDLWTSPHRHSLLAVCAQWVDPDYQLQKALLGLPECRYSHSGEKQAGLILDVLKDFQIHSKLGWHTGDNASSNDTCLEVLESRLLAEHRVEFNAKQRRIRCIGHIINLSLQAFLLASSKEALTAALTAASDVSGDDLLARFSEVLSSQKQKRRGEAEDRQPDETHQSQTRKKHTRRRESRGSQCSSSDEFSGIQNAPTLRKLHKLAVWLRDSSIHANLWDDAVNLRLGIDNRTKWSSWYQVIGRVIKKQTEMKSFMTDHEAALGDIRLTSQDWDFLRKAHTFLQPFASATLYAEGDKSSISQSLPLMDSLLVHYEKNKKHYSKKENYDPRMLCAIEMGWFVLDKYYRMTDEVPVFATALLLDPSRRAAYLRKNWPKAWVKPAIDAASKLWEDNFETRETDPSPAPLSMPPPETPSKKHGTELDKLMKDMDVTTEEELQDKDDFVAFTESTAVRIDCTSLEWWCRAEKRKNCPRLSRMAITILSIPAESSEPERTFSGTRRTCSWDRLRLSCLNIQKIESIGNWIREGHIRPLHLNGMGLPMGPAVEGDVDELDNEAMDETEYI